MIYNKNCGPVAIKTKKTMKLSRGFLAFVFIFGLSAALTAEARPRGKNSASPKFREDTRKRSLGLEPTRQHQSMEKRNWDILLRLCRLDPSNEALSAAFEVLKNNSLKDLEFFLTNVISLATRSEWRFNHQFNKLSKSHITGGEKSEFLFKDVIESILTRVGNNNGSGDKILLLKVVESMAEYMRGSNFTYWGGYKIASVANFLEFLSLTVRSSPKEASFKEILETTREKYNDSLDWRYYHKTGSPITLEVAYEGQKKVVDYSFSHYSHHD